MIQPNPNIMSVRVIASFLLLAFVSVSKSEADDRKPLDHGSYDLWNTILGPNLSADGRWFSYTLKPGKGDGTLVVRDTRSQTEHKIARGIGGRFTDDSAHFMLMISPDSNALKKARTDKLPEDQMPKSEMAILHLKTGTLKIIQRSKSYEMPKESSKWMAYLMTADPESKSLTTSTSSLQQTLSNGEKGLEPYVAEPASKAKPVSEPAKTQSETKPAVPATAVPGTPAPGARAPAAAPVAAKPTATEAKATAADDSKKPSKKKTAGTTMVLLNLESGMETRVPFVTELQFGDSGEKLIYATSGPEASHDGVWLVDLNVPFAPKRIAEGVGNYKNLTFDKTAKQVAYCSDRDDYNAKTPLWSVYLWSGEFEKPPEAIAKKGTKGIASEWRVRDSARVNFSKSGARLFFGVYPPSLDSASGDGDNAASTDSKPPAANDEPKAKLDVWHWSEPVLQTVQQVQVGRQRQQSYEVMYDVAQKSIVQLETEEIPSVIVSQEGDGSIALAVTNEPYRLYGTWESPGFADVWLIQIKTNKRQRVLEKFQGLAQLSPNGNYLVWWDGSQKHWFGMSTKTQKPMNLTDKIPHPLNNEEHDVPSLPTSYGSVGWTTGDRYFWIYDRFDIWQLDPTGKLPPSSITQGQGREKNTRYRRERLDAEETHIDVKKPQYLSHFCEGDKATGFSKLVIANAKNQLTNLLRLEETVGRLDKAKRSNDVVFTRQDFRQYPDYWKSDLDFKQLSRMTQANPQQRDYFWGTAELVKWKSSKGAPLEGLLYKPENFDTRKKYPTLVYFYERNSDSLHRYVPPTASASIINFSFYVSRGYLVFVPDVTYETGSPGQSAMDCIIPGVQELISRGFVDEKHIGIQGHSWGGYQAAYLVTQTEMFAAAEAGAPVSNMTSAYGGIRWESGLSRMFQYERSQSRIGKNLWESRDAFIQNSPIFFADRIKTPLLILHNDKDGAVPWYQGIELFMALRRLERPCWLLNYNDEPHGVIKEENRRDFSIRMQQFFDHYLKGDLPAEWMVTGIPATDKGKKFGLELVKPGQKKPNDKKTEVKNGSSKESATKESAAKKPVGESSAQASALEAKSGGKGPEANKVEEKNPK
ncbi:MAG: prolyl oligopeptidase family serine peptidase [Pirellula sp.]